MKIVLPHKIKLRPYQLEVWKSFFVEKKKRFLHVWHRRAGKDKLWWNILIAAAQTRVGNYFYMFPKLKQARKVIWDGIDKDGLKVLDHIPKELIAREPNNVEMKVVFKNNSTIQLTHDDYNDLVGSNPVGIVTSEYSLHNPKAKDYFTPILTENEGWASFVFTPRGANHAHKLYQSVKHDKDWFCNLLTVDDTKDCNGKPIITKKQIEEAARSGMTEDMVQQEFYCSFTAAVQGAYFGQQLRRAYEQDRVKNFIISTTNPVSSYWDLGIGDSTAIWLVQQIEGVPHLISYYENSGYAIQHYINFLHDFRNKYGIIYDEHFLPHDSINRSVQTGKTLIDFAKEMGLNPIRKVPRINKKINAIEKARHMIDRVVFHEEFCKEGLAALKEYHSEFYEKSRVFSVKPCHNWASHGSDAFMTFAQAWERKRAYNEARVFPGALRIKV